MSESQQGPEICDDISVMRYLVYLQNIYHANFKPIHFKEKSNFFLTKNCFNTDTDSA